MDEFDACGGEDEDVGSQKTAVQRWTQAHVLDGCELAGHGRVLSDLQGQTELSHLNLPLPTADSTAAS